MRYAHGFARTVSVYTRASSVRDTFTLKSYLGFDPELYAHLNYKGIKRSNTCD